MAKKSPNKVPVAKITCDKCGKVKNLEDYDFQQEGRLENDLLYLTCKKCEKQ